ncbi:PepSY domain-containing protein [Lysinibacillus fusiformis]|uniref:PepSY domain-containing protein n=1 Tax=Lysinibacillus fusiformis TaxID=28031 RepID=UPI0038293E7E
MKKWALLFIVIVLFCSGVLWFIQHRYFQKEPLSEEEAIRHIEAIYKGQVSEVKKRGNSFEIQFTRENLNYTAMLDATTQQVSDLTLPKGQSKLLLTENQIRKMVKEKYGEVESVMLTATIYTARVEKDHKQKDITVDGYSGEVLSEKDVEPLNQPETPHIITELQATDIALHQLTGKVDSVDFEDTADGGYYLVEIETEHEEATFQIHAVSGKVLSVSWDD